MTTPRPCPRQGQRRKLLAGVALLVFGLPAALAAPAPVKPPRIYMILFRGETPVEQGFRSYFAAHKLPVDLVVRNVAMDVSKVPALVAEARSMKADLIYTWGTPITLAVAGKEGATDPTQHVTDIPIVFTMVATPQGAGLVRSLTSSNRNLTGASHVVPANLQMNAIWAYRHFQRIGIIYNPNEINSQVNLREMRAEAERKGTQVLARPVPLDDNGGPRADALPGMIAELAEGGAQLLYLGPDSFMAANRKTVTDAALEHKLPTYSATEVWLREGKALFGLVSGYEAIGRLTAHKAAQVLFHKIRPAAIPIETLGSYSYLVNMDVARQLNLLPPQRVLQHAELIQ